MLVPPNHSRLRQLSAATRRALGLTLATAVVAYVGLLGTTYFQLTPPSSSWPDRRELDQLLFERTKPVSRIQRLLESSAGEMNRGGTMRPAFTEQSVDWELITKNMTADQITALKAEREGERLALLDWVRSGADHSAYENDDYELRASAQARQITAHYLTGENQLTNGQRPTRVRIRSLINDRCVTCHGEHGRHDTARFIPLDSYQNLQPHLQPEMLESGGRPWLIASLVGLFPLAIISAVLFQFSSQPSLPRYLLMALTGLSLGVLTAFWWLGQPHSAALTGLLAAAAMALLGIAFQLAASLHELFPSHR